MANLVRIKNLIREDDLNNVIIPVDKKSYLDNAKQISISGLTDFVLSGFTGSTMIYNHSGATTADVGGILKGFFMPSTGLTIQELFDRIFYSPTTTTTTTPIPPTTTTTTLPPTTTTTTSQGAFIFAADYMVIRYEFVSPGQDLDIKLRVVSPSIGQTNYVPGGVSDFIGFGNQGFWTVSGNKILDWGGDNTGSGFESVLVDLLAFKAAYPTEHGNMIIDSRAYWYSSGVPTTNPVNIDVTLYSGGTMIKDGSPNFTFSNPTAISSYSLTSDSSVVYKHNGSTYCSDRVAVITYGLVSGIGYINANDITTQNIEYDCPASFLITITNNTGVQIDDITIDSNSVSDIITPILENTSEDGISIYTGIGRTINIYYTYNTLDDQSISISGTPNPNAVTTCHQIYAGTGTGTYTTVLDVNSGGLINILVSNGACA